MKSNTLSLNWTEIKQQLSTNKREITVFATAFVVLICTKYLSETSNLIALFDCFGLSTLKEKAVALFVDSENSRFNSLIYWISALDFAYILIPLIAIKLVLKQRMRDFGFNLSLEKGFIKYYPIFMIFMLILVYFASKTDSFQSKYPFLKIYNSSQLDSKFLIWELFYCSQFFCLEFFFRGFLVKGLQNKFGLWSIFIMTIPYCMIHFGKPLPETIGSVFAGLILGYISYTGKGILAGFLMHITVALAMDGMALWQTGVLN